MKFANFIRYNFVLQKFAPFCIFIKNFIILYKHFCHEFTSIFVNHIIYKFTKILYSTNFPNFSQFLIRIHTCLNFASQKFAHFVKKNCSQICKVYEKKTLSPSLQKKSLHRHMFCTAFGSGFSWQGGYEKWVPST